ncbi:MAG: MBL fold metallo-hydrolase [Candidatus Micrarchaeota archaeon]
MVEIVFLGTGGGRINLIKQVRLTGGFRINSSSGNIHVDPGPGALISSNKFRQDPLKLDAVIITHDHVDHSNDGMVMCEAMSGYALRKKGILIGSGHVIDGDSNGDRAVDRFHQGHMEEVYTAKYGERKKFATKFGEFEIEIIRIDHDEPTAFGFKLFVGGKVIGYTSDTNYFDGLGESLRGCDFLVVNCLKPASDGIPDHLETSNVMELLKIAKPKICVLSHFGLKMLRAGPGAEARRIENATGVKTVAARDGQKMMID